MAIGRENPLRGRSLSVVIPAHNEERRIGRSLERILDYLGASGAGFEVIVVDDGSTDTTAEIVERIAEREPRVRLLRLGVNRGKGHAVRRGMLEATGEWILFSDADLSTPIEEVEKLVEPLRDGYAIAIGSRTIRGAQVEVHQPWYRETMGKTFNALVNLLALRGFVDTQCGFKCFSRSAAREVFNRTRIERFAFDVEALVVAGRLGLSIVEVPIRWFHSPHSSVSIVRDSSRMLLDLFRIRWNAVRGRYGPALGPARSSR